LRETFDLHLYSLSVRNKGILRPNISASLSRHPVHAKSLLLLSPLLLSVTLPFSNQIYKVSKGNKNRTFLRYSATYKYDLISLSTSDANRRNSCIRRYQYSTPVLRHQRYVKLNGFYSTRLILFKILVRAIGSVISPRTQ